MKNIEEFYFPNETEWRNWLLENHTGSQGIYLIFYKVEHPKESMRWEEAVQVALCFGWIDSTVKSLGNGKRRQYFCPRKPKSVWSKVNKTYIEELIAAGKMHVSGLESIKIAKKNGSWSQLDDVENAKIPGDLKQAFSQHPKAYKNFKNFTHSQKKSYLYWLFMAKREATRQKRILEIIQLSSENIKYRNTGAWG
ncbi:YdeI/OmpD-associated family protein [Cytophaga sp. FL35]|uniref:YdeI/OmpD-associated family protein n=1 Tax=Cytophaga sp. FL35 TaxID=1904456 RepID=UPI001653A8AF|nr:YdeI/OmpD-associated family protein [Cytophaga sp. FL35]MBC6996881.1 YdeI/OmpD-associated family protein [Cytophaga sp. FL35]